MEPTPPQAGQPLQPGAPGGPIVSMDVRRIVENGHGPSLATPPPARAGDRITMAADGGSAPVMTVQALRWRGAPDLRARAAALEQGWPGQSRASHAHAAAQHARPASPSPAPGLPLAVAADTERQDKVEGSGQQVHPALSACRSGPGAGGLRRQFRMKYATLVAAVTFLLGPADRASFSRCLPRAHLPAGGFPTGLAVDRLASTPPAFGDILPPRSMAPTRRLELAGLQGIWCVGRDPRGIGGRYPADSGDRRPG